MSANTEPIASAPSDRWGQLTARLVSASWRHPWRVLAVYVALLIGSAFAITTHLRMDADPADLMPDSLPWRQAALATEHAFPDQHHNIVAVVDARPEAARAALKAIREQLKAANAPIRSVIAPGLDPFFARNALLYLTPSALDALSANLESAQPILGRLVQQPGIAGLMSTLQMILDHQADSPAPAQLSPLLASVSNALNAAARGQQRAVDWQALALPGIADTPPRQFITFNPDNPGQNAAALAAVRKAIAALPDGSPQFRLTGEIPEWADELSAASRGAGLSALSSLLLVATLLMLGLRSRRLVGTALIGLLCGLILTAGFAAVTVGRLNLISIAFAALYIGLAIDFAVHLLLHFRELRSGGTDADTAMHIAGRDVGSALLLCGLTTSAGFYAFAPTAFSGVAELGLISGSGILIGLLLTLTLTPALMRLFQSHTLYPVIAAAAPPPRFLEWPFRYRRAIVIGAVILGALAATQLPDLRFDYNPMHLRPQHTESQQVYQELAGSDDSPLTATVLVAGADAARREVLRLQQLAVVKDVRWLGSLIPDHQQRKLEQIEDLAMSVGAGLPARLSLSAPDAAQDTAAMTQLQARIAAQPNAGSDWQSLGAALANWTTAHDTPTTQDLTALRNDLLGELPPLLQSLSEAMQATPITAETLPADVVAQWRSADGRYRLEVLPHANLNDDTVLLQFAASLHRAAPRASGPPLEYAAGAETVIGAFRTAFALAVAAIAILLVLLLRKPADCLRAVAPLALGTILTAGICAAIGLRLNFANIIALPLLLGVGLDNGIHLIWRARHDPGNPLAGSTGRGVLIAVLTTLSSFASLMLSPHRGMASMGAMLSIGLTMMLLCSFIVLPALLPQRRHADN